MKTNFELVKEFHAAFNKIPDPELPTMPEVNSDTLFLRYNLIREEFIEVAQELNMNVVVSEHIKEIMPWNATINLANLSKELADLLYVVYGTAAAYGIPIDEVYREVHRSNMSKLGEDGKPIYREDGKVLKGPNYSPANIKEVLKRYTNGKSTG